MLEYNFRWSDLEVRELRSFVGMYFGTEHNLPIIIQRSENTTYIHINYEELIEAEQNRLRSLQQVEKVLSTFNEGSDTDVLIQASSYITMHSIYRLESSTTFDSFWTKHNGDCVMYAFIFKQFADRLGLENDIIFVLPSPNTGHVYNRVLIDGEYKYYDLTNGIIDSESIYEMAYYVNIWSY